MNIGSARKVPDLASILGLVIGFGGVLGGLVLEGGKITDVAQLTGAIGYFLVIPHQFLYAHNLIKKGLYLIGLRILPPCIINAAQKI